MASLAQASSDPYDIAYSRFFESWLLYFLGDAPRSMAAAGQAAALSKEHGFPFPAALSQGILGWALAQLGNPDKGISLIRRSLSGFVETGSRICISDILMRLAEAQLLDGALDEALGTIEDALEANPEERVFQPNILTRRGELRLKLGQSELAETDFHEAIALAQKMRAKAWELRAATGLARMLQARSDRAAARDLLAPVYNWFKEGFNTADLKDAKMLLDELK
jgi:predicted ATPase